MSVKPIRVLAAIVMVTFGSCTHEIGSQEPQPRACVIRSPLAEPFATGIEKALRERAHNTSVTVQEISIDVVSAGALADVGCSVVIAGGPALQELVVGLAAAHPDQHFVIVGGKFSIRTPEAATAPNIQLVVFRTDQAAFIAGYTAGARSVTGRIAVVIGRDDDGSRLALDGFLAGVRAFAQDHDDHEVGVLGWNGRFVGDPAELPARLRAIVSARADVIFTDRSFSSRLEERLQSAGVGLIGYNLEPSQALTDLVTDNVSPFVLNAVEDTLEGSFTPGIRVGTLENGGVSFDLTPPRPNHPHHPSGGLASEIEQLRQGLINGWVSTNPDDYSGYDVHDGDGH